MCGCHALIFPQNYRPFGVVTGNGENVGDLLGILQEALCYYCLHVRTSCQPNLTAWIVNEPKGHRASSYRGLSNIATQTASLTSPFDWESMFPGPNFDACLEILRYSQFDACNIF